MDLTDEQWEVLEPRIPDPPEQKMVGADPGETHAMS
jgi:transposase